MSLFSKRRSSSADNAQTTEPFGTLLGVRHESSGGSMAFRSEFEIELTEKEIVRCAFWPQEPDREMVRKTHVPITAAQWQDVAQTAQSLWPLFHEVRPEPVLPPIPEVRILDGGDYSRWYLTRQTADGVRTAQYYQLDDRRICTLIALLRELADPIGRKIPRYDPPVLCGIYFNNEKKDYSFQCTPWDEARQEYRFIVYDHTESGKRSIYERVPNDVWRETLALLESLCIERLPAAAVREPVSCTLYYSDGKQKLVAPDARLSAKLQTAFAGLTERVQKQTGQKGEN